MAAADDLITRRNAIAAELAKGETPDGQSFRHPSISVDGESIATVEYVRSLYDELKSIGEVLAGLEGGFEVESIALG